MARPTIHECLTSGLTVYETVRRTGLTTAHVEAVRARHNLPRNRPIKPGTRAERDALSLLIFFQANPHNPDLCSHLSVSPPILQAILDRVPSH